MCRHAREREHEEQKRSECGADGAEEESHVSGRCLFFWGKHVRHHVATHRVGEDRAHEHGGGRLGVDRTGDEAPFSEALDVLVEFDERLHRMTRRGVRAFRALVHLRHRRANHAAHFQHEGVIMLRPRGEFAYRIDWHER